MTELTTEIFPLRSEALPPLIGYTLELTTHDDPAMVGGKLAYELRRRIPGHWFWSRASRRLVSDQSYTEEQLKPHWQALWSLPSGDFRGLRAIRSDKGWQVGPGEQADYVAFGLADELAEELQSALQPYHEELPPTLQIWRTFRLRGWLVQGKPAISISVHSQPVLKQDLRSFCQTLAWQGQEELEQRLRGLRVKAKDGDLCGQIVQITGRVGTERQRLLALATRESSRRRLQQAGDEEAVVLVQTARSKEYEYPLSGLRLIVQPGDYERLGLDSSQVHSRLHLAPSRRAAMVSALAQPLQERGLIRSSAYNSRTEPTLFRRSVDLDFRPRLRVGRQRIIDGDKEVLSGLQRHGFYRPAPPLAQQRKLRVGLILTDNLSQERLTAFAQELGRAFQNFQAPVKFFLKRLAHKSKEALEEVIETLQRERADDALLALMPDQEAQPLAREETSLASRPQSWTLYHHFKAITIGRDLPSQVVLFSTLNELRFAASNIALGLLSKMGGVPYVLAEPLPYTDVIVGIDIARRRKVSLPGSVSLTAQTRIFQNDGQLLQYRIADTVIDGETIPAELLQQLFPQALFAGKRVLIQRDGPYCGREKQDLQEWAQRIGATFLLVEVLKQGAPRLYNQQSSSTWTSPPRGRGQEGSRPASLRSSAPAPQYLAGITSPPKGSTLLLNDYEALLVSTLPPSPAVTPEPLHIRSEPPFPIEQALHSVLALTLLHAGSLRPPRLPVTIHYSDELGGLALVGIRPPRAEGTLPFWL
ncbi:Piwi domain-containing protein [Thermogemmatispora sp.]|uniref:Piwi domain-containing protein n=1 Tax=Thermogemmatispora sp. TaxID=1968838 RepID=UPI0035E45FDF